MPRATERTTPSRTVPRSHWDRLGDAFRVTATRDLNLHRSRYLRALQDGDPYVRFLELAGGRFTKGHIVPPSLGSLFACYLGLMEERVKSGRLSGQDVLKPGQVFKTTGGHAAIGFGEPIPSGLSQIRDVAPAGEFYRMVARGYFPVSNLARTTGYRHSLLAHDVIGHFGSFAFRPDFMAELKRFCTKVIENDRPIPSEKDLDAAFYAVELMPLFKRGAWRSLLERLPKPLVAGMKRPVLQVRDMQALLDGVGSRDVRRLAAMLHQNYHGLVEHGGGSLFDLPLRWCAGFRAWEHSWNMREAMRPHAPMSSLRRDVARFLVFLSHLRRLQPAEWFSQLERPRIHRRSKLYRFACLSGVWDERTSAVYEIHSRHASVDERAGMASLRERGVREPG